MNICYKTFKTLLSTNKSKFISVSLSNNNANFSFSSSNKKIEVSKYNLLFILI
jgi:hypothetical protein